MGKDHAWSLHCRVNEVSGKLKRLGSCQLLIWPVVRMHLQLNFHSARGESLVLSNFKHEDHEMWSHQEEGPVHCSVSKKIFSVQNSPFGFCVETIKEIVIDRQSRYKQVQCDTRYKLIHINTLFNTIHYNDCDLNRLCKSSSQPLVFALDRTFLRSPHAVGVSFDQIFRS